MSGMLYLIFEIEIGLFFFSIKKYMLIQKHTDFQLILRKLNQLSVHRDIRYRTLISKLITSRQIEQDF